MSDTSSRINIDEYIIAKTIDININVTTHSIPVKVTTVSTSRIEGIIELRLAPREIPERKTTATTCKGCYGN